MTILSSQPRKPLSEISIIKINVFIVLVGMLIRTLTNICFARWLGVAEYGDISVAISVLELLAVVSLIGANSATSQIFSVYVIQKDWSRAKAFVSTAVLFVLTCSLLLIFLSIVLLFCYEYWRHGQFKIVPEEIHLFFYSLWIIPFWALAKLFNAFITSLHHPILAKLWQRLLRPSFCLMIIFLYTFFTKKLNALTALFGFSASVLAFTGTQLYYFIITLPKNIKTHDQKQYEFHYWLKTTLRFFLIGLIVNILPNVDLIILETLNVPEDMVGYFSVILRVIPLIWVLYDATNAVMSPRFAELYKTDRRLFRQKFYLVQRLILLGAGLIFIVLQLFMHQFILLFGAKYELITPLARVMTTVASIQVGFSTMQIALQYSGYERLFSRVIMTALLMNITLDVIFIPHYQLHAAVFSYAITSCSITIATLYLGYKELGLMPLPWLKE